MYLTPFPGTRTERRSTRQQIRNALGVSGDPAPTLRTLFRVARELHRLVHETSGGRYGVAIVATQGARASTARGLQELAAAQTPAVPGLDELTEAENAWSE